MKIIIIILDKSSRWGLEERLGLEFGSGLGLELEFGSGLGSGLEVRVRVHTWRHDQDGTNY